MPSTDAPQTEAATLPAREEPYFFPGLGVTILAASFEEAQEKARKHPLYQG